MPQKNRVKVYVKDGYYHAYNRGVEKRDIFLDDQDYRVFLYLLKYYLSPIDDNTPHPLHNLPNLTPVRPRPLANLANDVDLLSYCLMPNHYHLLIKQKNSDDITKFIRRLSTTYAMYFNKRYDRVGTLFQGSYKAVLVTEDQYLIHLSKYIHMNPLALTRSDPVNYPYSSLQHYLGLKKANWVKPRFILKFFESQNMLPFLMSYPSYEKFMNGNVDDPKEILGNLAID